MEALGEPPSACRPCWNEGSGHRAHGKEGGRKGACLAPEALAWPGSLAPHRVAVEVVTTMTSADVMWQDGSVECNIRSNDLFPVHHLDNNEFCPGDFVVDKRGSAGSRRHSHCGLAGLQAGKRVQLRGLPVRWLLL